MGTTGTSPRIAILFKNRLHPAHAGLADVIGADRFRLPGIDRELLAGSVLEDIQGVLRTLSSIPTDYDVYLSEDAVGLYATPFLARRTDATHIYLAANHRTFGLEGYEFGPPWNPFAVCRRVDRMIDSRVLGSVLNRHVDGVIAVSQLMADNIGRIAPGTPTRVAHAFVEPALFDRLGDVEPSLESNHAIFVGKNRLHKGVNMLVQAWSQVRDVHPDATLELVGYGHDDHSEEGVSVGGYVEDVADAYQSASLYINPARFDPFPVTVLEAMRAGVPTVATTRCGVAPYLASVDDALCCEPTIDALAEAITAYFDREWDGRRELSRTSRQLAPAFEPTRSKRAFAEQFHRLLRDIEVVDDGSPTVTN